MSSAVILFLQFITTASCNSLSLMCRMLSPPSARERSEKNNVIKQTWPCQLQSTAYSLGHSTPSYPSWNFLKASSVIQWYPTQQLDAPSIQRDREVPRTRLSLLLPSRTTFFMCFYHLNVLWSTKLPNSSSISIFLHISRIPSFLNLSISPSKAYSLVFSQHFSHLRSVTPYSAVATITPSERGSYIRLSNPYTAHFFCMKNSLHILRILPLAPQLSS